MPVSNTPPRPDRRQFVKSGGGLLALSALPLLSGDLPAQATPRRAAPAGPIVEGFPPPELVGRPRPVKLELGLPPEERIGFAIVGLGNYACNLILPNLGNTKQCKLSALVSGNDEKRGAIAKAYGIADDHLYDYDNFGEIADDPEVDVVYIITPNVFHRELTERAFAAGKHVLCEKPMAVTAEDCRAMIDAGKRAGKKLMIAYRAQFDPYNLMAIDLIREGRIGTPQQVMADHGRLLKLDEPADQWRAKQDVAGGGSLYDIGIYSINGARYLLGEEPTAVRARYHEGSGREEVTVEEGIQWELIFPSGAVATCSSSYLIADNKRIHVQGEAGEVTLDPATDYHIRHLSIVDRQQENRRVEEIQIPNTNQFAAVLDEMAAAVREDRPPKAAGEEGLRDVVIMQAIYEAARTGKEVAIS